MRFRVEMSVCVPVCLTLDIEVPNDHDEDERPLVDAAEIVAEIVGVEAPHTNDLCPRLVMECMTDADRDEFDRIVADAYVVAKAKH